MLFKKFKDSNDIADDVLVYKKDDKYLIRYSIFDAYTNSYDALTEFEVENGKVFYGYDSDIGLNENAILVFANPENIKVKSIIGTSFISDMVVDKRKLVWDFEKKLYDKVLNGNAQVYVNGTEYILDNEGNLFKYSKLPTKLREYLFVDRVVTNDFSKDNLPYYDNILQEDSTRFALIDENVESVNYMNFQNGDVIYKKKDSGNKYKLLTTNDLHSSDNILTELLRVVENITGNSIDFDSFLRTLESYDDRKLKVHEIDLDKLLEGLPLKAIDKHMELIDNPIFTHGLFFKGNKRHLAFIPDQHNNFYLVSLQNLPDDIDNIERIGFRNIGSEYGETFRLFVLTKDKYLYTTDLEDRGILYDSGEYDNYGSFDNVLALYNEDVVFNIGYEGKIDYSYLVDSSVEPENFFNYKQNLEDFLMVDNKVLHNIRNYMEYFIKC